MTKVSQRAREAAAELFAHMGGTPTGCDMMRAGEADDAPAIKAFAAFEQQIVSDIAAWIDDYEPVSCDTPEFESECFAAERIAERLRNPTSP